MAVNPKKHSYCTFCKDSIHLGRKGWLHVDDDWLRARYDCPTASNRVHVPESLVGSMEEPFLVLERTLCEACGHEIAWLEDLQAWTDVFFIIDGSLVAAGSWTGSACGKTHNWDHRPTDAYMIGSLREVCEDLE